MKVFDKLEEAVKFCGNYAVSQQSLVTRDYKSDGSVLTEADIYIDSYLKKEIARNFPNSVIITEESERVEKSQGQEPDYYFILDPIDGTDIYSQGAPGWCVALGILDTTLAPCGCMIYAPRWGIGTKEGLFLRLDPGEELLLNQKPFIPEKSDNTSDKTIDKTVVNQLVISSNTHRYLDLSHYTGKCRIFGSSIIHLLAPVIHINIDATLSISGYIWDIAAAHSVLLHLGLVLVKTDGTDFTYSRDMMNGKPNTDILYAGSRKQCDYLRTIFQNKYFYKETGIE